MLASASDDLRVWDGDKYDDLVKHYTPNVPKISSLAWNSINSLVVSTAPGGCSIDVTHLDSDVQSISYPILDETVCVCWHSSSRYVAMGCTDGLVKVYDLKTKTTKKTYTGHKNPLTCITYNYNDTSIASASKAGEIILHNTITDLTTRLITTLKLQAIQGLQYSFHHHSMLASVSDDASLVLWDTSARRSVHQFTRSHKAPATDLTFSPANDRLVMSCGLDKNIVLYDVLNKSIVRTLQVDEPLSTISMHPDGYQVATGTIKGRIFLHDLRQGSKIQHQFTAHRSSVHCLAFHNRIRPKKAKNSSSISSTHSTSTSISSDSRHIEEQPQPLQPLQPPPVPLSTLDQNVKNGLVGSPRLPDYDADMADKPLTPSYTANGDNISDAGSVREVDNSVFSPDVTASSRQSSIHIDNLSMSSLQNGLSSKHAGNSLFSPDSHVSVNGSLPRPPAQQQHNSPNLDLHNSAPRHQRTIPTTSKLFQSTPHTRRELPAPPSPTSAAAVRVSPPQCKLERVSPPQRKLVSNVHFTPSTQASGPGLERHGAAAAMAGSGDTSDPLTQRIKDDLKQQLKSELVGEIRDMIEQVKDDLNQSLMDHHFDMIKQFYLMQVHVETHTSHHSLNHDLLRENEELKAEIERLKRTY